MTTCIFIEPQEKQENLRNPPELKMNDNAETRELEQPVQGHSGRLRDRIQIFNSNQFVLSDFLSFKLLFLGQFLQMPAWPASFFSSFQAWLLPGPFTPHHVHSNQKLWRNMRISEWPFSLFPSDPQKNRQSARKSPWVCIH